MKISQQNLLNFGGAIKLSFEIQKFTNLRLSIAAGVGKKIEGIDFIYPSIHLDCQLYNGGIGSSLLNEKRGNIILDINTSLLITGGIRQIRENHVLEKFNPLNYFSAMSAKPLQNPYFNSFSLGSNYIISTDKDKNNQLVGVMNVNFERTLQITYYNDGTPWGHLLGDGYDRYHTGGEQFRITENTATI